MDEIIIDKAKAKVRERLNVFKRSAPKKVVKVRWNGQPFYTLTIYTRVSSAKASVRYFLKRLLAPDWNPQHQKYTFSFSYELYSWDEAQAISKEIINLIMKELEFIEVDYYN